MAEADLRAAYTALSARDRGHGAHRRERLRPARESDRARAPCSRPSRSCAEHPADDVVEAGAPEVQRDGLVLGGRGSPATRSTPSRGGCSRLVEQEHVAGASSPMAPKRCARCILQCADDRRVDEALVAPQDTPRPNSSRPSKKRFTAATSSVASVKPKRLERSGHLPLRERVLRMARLARMQHLGDAFVGFEEARDGEAVGLMRRHARRQRAQLRSSSQASKGGARAEQFCLHRRDGIDEFGASRARRRR